ncbi:MAG: hypothetical protein JNM14_08805 [Ferruginibacter sp.]|nr:hypothetical protein [Ferruginibacter sp.]
MPARLKKQKLTLFSVLLMLLFTFPLISVANRAAVFAGIPVLFLYIFIVWIVAIIILYRIAETKQKKTGE